MREKIYFSKIFIFLKIFILFLAAVCNFMNPDEFLFPLLQIEYVILLKFGDKLKGEQCLLKNLIIKKIKYSSFFQEEGVLTL